MLLAIIVSWRSPARRGVTGSAWQHDPWLRLLSRVRRRLRQQGVEYGFGPAAPDCDTGHNTLGAKCASIAEWLLKTKRFGTAATVMATWRALRREFKQLAWPN